MKKNNKKGFTIVELVIVIAVIAILAAVLIPTFTGVVEKAEENKAMQNARNAWTEYVAEKHTETLNRVFSHIVLNSHFNVNNYLHNTDQETWQGYQIWCRC